MDSNAELIKSEGLYSDDWTCPRWRAAYSVPRGTTRLELSVWSPLRAEAPNGYEVHLETLLEKTSETLKPETLLTMSAAVPEPLDGLCYFEVHSQCSESPPGEDIRTLGVVIVKVDFS